MSVSSPPPLVGIGMPVYNGERFVAEAIESILRQSLTDLELAICDNASSDRTEAICRSFATSDARVRYFRSSANLGAHPNYNRAFELSRGKYFKWAAHDDVLRPDFLRACVVALERAPDAAVCQSEIEYINERGESLGVHKHHVAGSESGDPVERFSALVLRPHDCYDMMGVFRRSILEDSMLLPSFHGADRALLAQLALRGRFIRVAEPLIQVRDHAERYSRAQKKPRERATWHDTRVSRRLSFPVWRLYRTYWVALAGASIGRAQRARASAALLGWWFRNFNSARMAVDLVAAAAPGMVRVAERVKQSWFSPEPGPGEVRRSNKR